MLEKLAQQRRETEQHTGGTVTSGSTTKKARGRIQKRNIRVTNQDDKCPGRPTAKTQPSRSSRRKRTSEELPIPDSLEEGNKLGPPRADTPVNKVPSESGADTEMVDEEIHVEKAFNEAFEELDDDISDDTLEELFNDPLSAE
jgi:hypothetical protein